MQEAQAPTERIVMGDVAKIRSAASKRRSARRPGLRERQQAQLARGEPPVLPLIRVPRDNEEPAVDSSEGDQSAVTGHDDTAGAQLLQVMGASRYETAALSLPGIELPTGSSSDASAASGIGTSCAVAEVSSGSQDTPRFPPKTPRDGVPTGEETLLLTDRDVITMIAETIISEPTLGTDVLGLMEQYLAGICPLEVFLAAKMQQEPVDVEYLVTSYLAATNTV